MPNPEYISISHFVNMMKANPGAHTITFATFTKLKMKQTYPFGYIYKREIVHGVINQDPARQRRRNGGVYSTPLFDKNHEYYLTVKVKKITETSYVNAQGDVLNIKEITPYFYAKDCRKSTKKNIIRHYNINNVVKIEMDNQIFRIIKMNLPRM